ncbi:D-alanyl-D-alanine-carboxypeptidase/endopeptidase AmpH [Alphaproteobacteria bacterium SO-S41]|nr:D-alanyl-D-alanine-carboxypeptidase/endopeptidase AmpH [Alphaproteobacteria bacterium SO-S41]
MTARFTFLCAFVGAFFTANAADLTGTARTATEAMFAAGKPPGMVVAVVRGNEVFLAGYGETAPGSGVVPNEHSLVRLASLSKLLTADVLAAMTADGEVTLADALQDHAPPDRIVPTAKSGTAITLLNLATHTSGLGREASGPRWDWLEKQKKLKAPGLSAAYSNVAFDLLGDALAAAGGAPYPDLLARYTTTPLAMSDTTASPNTEQCRRMIRGGVPARPCADQADMAGAGGVYSTAVDMARWMQFQLRAGDAADPRRQIGHRIYFPRDALNPVDGLDHAGKANAIGLAWIELLPDPETEVGVRLLEKTGNIGGFMSYIAIVPEAHVGVFVAMARPADPGPAMKAVVKGVNALATTLASGP